MNRHLTNIVYEKFPCQVKVWNDSSNLIESLVDVLESRLRLRLTEVAPKPLGLATGRTMQPIYMSLVLRLQSWSLIDLDRLLEGWCSFNLDEYVGLKCDDIRSYASYMSSCLGKPLRLAPSKMRIPDGFSTEPQKEATLYAEQLKSLGGIGIQLLGLGENGHLGFNEPPCSPDTTCRVVSLAASTRKQNAFSFRNNLQLVPASAITLGLKEILSADEIHLVVTGANKADILFSLLHDSASDKLPASWLRRHKNLFLWVDYNALSKMIAISSSS